MDGKSCPVNLAGSLHTNKDDNDHYPGTIVGDCPGIGAGDHKIDIALTGNGDCHTGWTPSPKVMHALIEVREGLPTPPAGKATLSDDSLTDKNDSNGADDASALPKRTLKFTKKRDDTTVKFVYADNLRVIGSNQWCRWTIKIDGQDCPSGAIYNTLHTASGDNDHHPHGIVGTCERIVKGTHTMSIRLSRSSSDADCYTGWSADGARDAFYMEAEEMNPDGQVYSVMRWPGADGRDNGLINTRVLPFVKRSATSDIRITWGTNLRSKPKNEKGGSECNWEVLIDGKSCGSPSKIGASLHAQSNDNDHNPVAVVGWCKNIGVGTHEVTVNVQSSNENFDCYTGWATHDYMEVWEPLPEEQKLVSYFQAVGTDSSADKSNALLSLAFTKVNDASKSTLRILYYDNLRNIGHGTVCRWETLVDGKSCPVPIAGSLHTHKDENDHVPATILGQCPGIGAGSHKITVKLSGTGDCHTGWTPGIRSMHALIEVQEHIL